MKKFILLSGIFSLASCSPLTHNEDIPANYLKCYALENGDKHDCTSKLANKFLDKDWQQDEAYARAFQYAAEKIGFKNFINNQALPCKRVEEGPSYIGEERAYLVKCKPDRQYLMKFDYENKEWKLLEIEDKK